MQIGFHVEPARVKTPKWLRGKFVCPMRRGDEIWWRTDYMMVRGLPPDGVQYAHETPHIIPADYGPKGEPTQVSPRIVQARDVLACVDQMGEIKTRIPGKIERFLRSQCKVLGGAPRYFYYSDIEEGQPQQIAVVRAFQQPKTDGGFLSFLGGTASDEDLYEDVFEPLAFVMPITFAVNYDLTIEQMTKVPRFGGTEGLVPDEH